jgi:hypothetical protein
MESTMTTLEMIALELALVYTEDYALQITNEIVENTTDDNIKAYLLSTPRQEASKYIMLLFSWAETKQGGKYWARIEKDMIDYEKELIEKIIKGWKEQQ